MMDAETNKRIDELEELLESGHYSTQADVLVMAIVVAVLTVVAVIGLIVTFRVQICEQIGLELLKQMFGPLPPPG